MTARSPAPTAPIRLAVWYGKGGVGKSTTTMLLSLLLAARGERVLVVDLDPECGTSRDFLGSALGQVPHNLKSFLASPVPMPLPVVSSGIDGLDLVPMPPDEQRFFRLLPDHSAKLSDGLALLPPEYQWVFMDVPNQFDNVAELGLIAADYLILPVELTADCVERIGTAIRIIDEARALNPRLQVLGALALGATPRAGHALRLSAKERLIHREYEEVLAAAGIRLFRTIMYRSVTTVEEARSNVDPSLLHWTARRRFHSLLAEIHLRIRSRQLLSSPLSHGRPRLHQSRRTTAKVA